MISAWVGTQLTKNWTAQKKKFSIKDFFGIYDQIRRKLRIWSHLLKKFLMENFIFWALLEANFLDSKKSKFWERQFC